MEHKDTLKQISSSCDSLLDVAYELNKLSHSFFAVGNEFIANKLSTISVRISDEAEMIRESKYSDIDYEHETAMKMSSAVLALALNGNLK